MYITPPKLQNEDPFKKVWKSLKKGSNVILDQSRSEAKSYDVGNIIDDGHRTDDMKSWL